MCVCVCVHFTKVWLLLLLSRVSRVQYCVTPQTAAQQAPLPWDSPGKNTGLGCHFLLQCMKVKSESEVAQSCPTLSDPMDCSLPGSSIHGILQARVLEWGAIQIHTNTKFYTEFMKQLLLPHTSIWRKVVPAGRFSSTTTVYVELVNTGLLSSISKTLMARVRVEWRGCTAPSVATTTSS